MTGDHPMPCFLAALLSHLRSQVYVSYWLFLLGSWFDFRCWNLLEVRHSEDKDITARIYKNTHWPRQIGFYIMNCPVSSSLANTKLLQQELEIGDELRARDGWHCEPEDHIITTTMEGFAGVGYRALDFTQCFSYFAQCLLILHRSRSL
jgi:hypothetical protein